MTATLPIRVTVLDTWDEIHISAPVTASVAPDVRDGIPVPPSVAGLRARH